MTNKVSCPIMLEVSRHKPSECVPERPPMVGPVSEDGEAE